MQRIGTKFYAISEPESAINQTWVKIHVSNGYHKRFYKMFCESPIQMSQPPKIHPKINLLVGPNNFPKINFRIILTWQQVFMISQVWARLEYHLHICSFGQLVLLAKITQIFKFPYIIICFVILDSLLYLNVIYSIISPAWNKKTLTILYLTIGR
jgi:hypothetical protein